MHHSLAINEPLRRTPHSNHSPCRIIIRILRNGNNKLVFFVVSLLFLHHVISPTTAFTAHSTRPNQARGVAPEKECFTIDVATDCSDHIVALAAEFLVDTFWLGSSRQWLRPNQYQTTATRFARNRLIQRQINDFSTKYGDQNGERRLKSCFVWASQENHPLGILSMNILLLDRASGDVLSPELSEHILDDAFASLRPARRKLYQYASIATMAKDLLQNMEVVCFVSNVAVAPEARRRGVALQLCHAAEHVALESGFRAIYLKVEADNAPARKLYEEKLAYSLEYTVRDDVALRLDMQKGKIVETTMDSLILKKPLQRPPASSSDPKAKS